MSTNPSPFGGGGGFQPWEFHVTPIGGGANDTPNLLVAWNAAWNYAANNQGKAFLLLDPALYTLSSATIKNTTTKGNAQLPVPVYGTGVSGPSVEVRCVRGSSAPNTYFNQTVPQVTGPVLQSTLTGQVIDGTFGSPSIIGGPTPPQGFGSVTNTWNNVFPVIDGITFIAPLNPTIAAMDFRGCAKMSVPRAACIANATITQMQTTAPTSSWAVGLYTPQNLNNANQFIGDLTVYGFYAGGAFGEHVNFQKMLCLYCIAGMQLQLDTFGNHGWAGVYYASEGNNFGIQGFNLGAGSAIRRGLYIGNMDVESAGFYAAGFHIDDTGGSSNLGGWVGIADNNGASDIKINGCADLEIICLSQPGGVQGAPTYTLGTAFQNPWWRHSWITLNNGTTTGILIGPTSAAATTSVGTVTTSPVTFRLPSGWWLNIQGTVKPTTFNAVLD